MLARTQAAYRAWFASTALCLCGAALALIGWQWRIPAIKGLPGQLTVVAPNTALCFVVLSVAMILLKRHNGPKSLRVIGRLLAVVVAIFAGLTLLEYLGHLDFGIDSVLFHSRMQDWQVPSQPGRFAIQTAISFLGLGIALCFLDKKIKSLYLSDLFALAALLPPILAFLGYIYHARALYGLMSGATLALFCFALISLALMRPEAGATGLLLSSNSGGIAARRLITANTLVLTTFGLVFLRIHSLGFLEREYAVALLIAACLISVTILIFFTARKLDHLAREREAAMEALSQSLAEKEESEDRLNEGLETANAAIWDMNYVTGELYWSRCHYTLLGYLPYEVKPTFDHWRNRVHPDDLQPVEDIWETSLKLHRRFICQYRVVWPDASVHWMETQGKFMYDENGLPIRSIGGFVDITDRKHSEQALMEAEKLAVTGRMAATLAHEINNPLAAVTNLIYLLKLQPNADTMREFLQIADDEIRRVAQLVQKTLSFYRADLRPAATRIPDLIDEVLWLYQKRLHESSIRIKKRYKSSSEILCNAAEIRQVLTNVLVNAIEALPTGGEIQISVAGTRNWSNGSARGVRVVIADNGSGIPAEHRDRLFTPFFSLKGERGTGLGLWISKGIIEKNGGAIRFRSRTEQPSGTVFSVFIPDLSQEAKSIALSSRVQTAS